MQHMERVKRQKVAMSDPLSPGQCGTCFKVMDGAGSLVTARVRQLRRLSCDRVVVWKDVEMRYASWTVALSRRPAVKALQGQREGWKDA